MELEKKKDEELTKKEKNFNEDVFDYKEIENKKKSKKGKKSKKNK